MIENKLTGETSEIAFVLRALHSNFVVSKPYGDSARYDMIVDYRGKISRVQIKSSAEERNGRHTVNIKYGGRKGYRSYTKSDIDFLAAHLHYDTWFIIPVEALVNHKTTITLKPRTDCLSIFNQYEEAWHLMMV